MWDSSMILSCTNFRNEGLSREWLKFKSKQDVQHILKDIEAAVPSLEGPVRGPPAPQSSARVS